MTTQVPTILLFTCFIAFKLAIKPTHLSLQLKVLDRVINRLLYDIGLRDLLVPPELSDFDPTVLKLTKDGFRKVESGLLFFNWRRTNHLWPWRLHPIEMSLFYCFTGSMPKSPG